jgi:NAD(P)-dependent dehydrogenase (short-subunit alcohol dehydrogenase family)
MADENSQQDIKARIKPILDHVAVDGLRAWLRTIGFSVPRLTRAGITDLVVKHIAEGQLAESALESTLIGFEEASNMRSFVALSEVAAYAASKAGLVSLTRSLAVEWSKRGVTVNAIAPGVFHTEMNAGLLDNTPRGHELLMRTPMGRFGRNEELVGAAVYLASEAASFVTGETLVVDGGFLASGVNQ